MSTTSGRPRSMVSSQTASGDPEPVAPRGRLWSVVPMALAWLPVAVIVLIRLFAQHDQVATAAVVIGNVDVLLPACALSWMLGIVLVATRPAGPHGVRGRGWAVAACVVPLPLFLLVW